MLKKVTVDRLSVVGDRFQGIDLGTFLSGCIALKGRGGAKYPYRDTYYFVDGSILQVAEIECVRAGKVKELRYEFNPSHAERNEVFGELYMQVLRLFSGVEPTRIDLAMDFELDMGQWRWFDSHARKRNIWYGLSGAVETVYFGSPQSDWRVRIYDKRKERQEAVEGVQEWQEGLTEVAATGETSEQEQSPWWRVEAQLRGNVARGWWFGRSHGSFPRHFNPFDGITPDVSDKPFPELGVKERAMCHYLRSHPEAFSELAANTRSKYKKLLQGLSVLEAPVDLGQEYEQKKAHFVQEVRDWLALAYIG